MPQVAAFAPVTPLARQPDGQFYVNAVTMPVANADTDLLATPSPVDVRYGHNIGAEVTFTASGSPASNSTFVVMQGRFGVSANWFDMSWCAWTGTTGSASFCLTNGEGGSNAFQQTRVAGAAPASNSSNQMPLPGEIRFVGRSTLSGGTNPAVTVTVIYKLGGLR